MDDTTRISQEVEIRRCAEDFVYFCETYIKIVDPKLGLINLILHPYQKRYIKHIEENRFCITKKFRQGGFTKLNAAWALWRGMFKFDEVMMFLTKTDREAIWISDYIKTMTQELPDWLKPKFEKENDHTRIFADTGCKMFFYKPEASKGRAITYLFLDEAAFIECMDKWWRCIFPTISTGGHCIAYSTPNGKKNWFHDFYTAAEKLENNFKIFRCSYLDHPEYRTAEWSSKMKHQLGAKGWRQEVLTEFLSEDTRSHNQKIEDSIKYYEDMVSADEFIKSLQHNGPIEMDYVSDMPDLRSARKTYPDRISEELLFENGDETGLDWMFEETYTEKPKPIDPFPPYEPEGYCFKSMTWDEQKAMVEDYEKRTANAVTHAEFDKFAINDLDDMTEFWTTYAAIYPQFEDIKDLWRSGLIERNQKWQDREDRINESLNNDMFVMSGLLSKAEAANSPEISRFARPDLKIIDQINNSGRYPKELKISFLDDRLCINRVPTVIKEDDLRDLYNGMFSLIGYEQAIETTVKAITSKLDELFVKEKANELLGQEK